MSPHALLLAYAGLIPFVVLPFLVVTDRLALFEGMQYFNQYSAVILSFFGGLHWLEALRDRNQVLRMYLAMLPSIVAWLSLVFLPIETTIIFLMVAYGAVLMFDFKYFQNIPGYMQLRLRLTSIVLGCHGTLLWLYYQV